MEKGEEKPEGRRKARLIVRLGAILVSHSILVSILCCTAGFVALFLLPVLAKNTYVSENALMPGSANPMFSGQDMQEASRFIKDVIGQISMATNGIETSRLIAQRMADVGAEVYYHKFHPQKNLFHLLHFFSSAPDTGFVHVNGSCSSVGVNSVGIIRAPRGDGKESIVLVTPYNSEKIELSEAMSLGVALSVFSLLSRAAWLAKDIVWLAVDSRYGEYSSVAAWLRDYYNPVFLTDAREGNVDMCTEGTKGRNFDVFRRAGTMAAALVLKVTEKREGNNLDSLTIYAEASNGQMPNLDLINIVQYLAVHRQGLNVKIGKIGSLINSAWLNIVGKTLEWTSRMAGYFNSQWKFGIPAADYIEGSATLASSMYYQALGVPTGSHGAFRDYQIDAITLEISPRISLDNEVGQSAIVLRGGRLIEGVIRSINNLLEKFHQSFFLYFLTSPSKFVSVGVYMIAFALLVAPLPIVTAALFSGNHETNKSRNDASNQKTYTSDSGKVGGTLQTWKWLHAARVVFTVHIWAAIASLMPHFISQFPDLTSTTSMLAWVSLSIVTLLILYLISGSPYSCSRPDEWVILKAVMIAAVSIGLGLMSIVNFATAQIGALVVVPVCLVVHPVRRHRAVLLTAFNLILGVIAFPPAAFLILEGMTYGLKSVSIGDFWVWTESLRAWNSATYLYLLLVHLPCWVLCIHVLLHP